MLKIKHTFLFLFIIKILITKIYSEDYPYNNVNIIDFCLEQEYNIQDKDDIFFNDICSIFYSNTKRDVSLEYRRKYYYYPNSIPIMLDENSIKEIFPEIKRNNILFCFKHHFNIKAMAYNLILHIIIIIFSMQITSFILILRKSYKTASENNYEKYLIYQNKKKETNKSDNKINKTFSPLNEEINLTNGRMEESKDINLNTPNGLENINNYEDPHLLNNQLDKNEDSKKSKESIINSDNKQINKQFNIDELYTFGAVKMKIDEKNYSLQTEKNNIKENEKDSNGKYNNNEIIPSPNITNNKNKIKEITLLSDELFYSGYVVALLKDERNIIQIYFDILSHCQIIFICKQKFFIYEDTRVKMLFYSIKLILYSMFNIIFLNSVSTINKIYDKKLSFLDCLYKCLIVVIIVNIISQILFIFSNSKKRFIKHIHKLRNSLYNRKEFLKYSINEIIEVINYYLYGKLIILFILSIIIFLIGFYLSLCFCSTYYYTQFIVLQNIIICIIISQIIPFILAFIPACLRKKSLQKKSEKLYNLSKFINLFFIP